MRFLVILINLTIIFSVFAQDVITTENCRENNNLKIKYINNSLIPIDVAFSNSRIFSSKLNLEIKEEVCVSNIFNTDFNYKINYLNELGSEGESIILRDITNPSDRVEKLATLNECISQDYFNVVFGECDSFEFRQYTQELEEVKKSAMELYAGTIIQDNVNKISTNILKDLKHNRVVIVGHGQGSLYSERVLDEVAKDLELSEYRSEAIGSFDVASFNLRAPSGNYDYVTANADPDVLGFQKSFNVNEANIEMGVANQETGFYSFQGYNDANGFPLDGNEFISFYLSSVSGEEFQSRENSSSPLKSMQDIFLEKFSSVAQFVSDRKCNPYVEYNFSYNLIESSNVNKIKINVEDTTSEFPNNVDYEEFTNSGHELFLIFNQAPEVDTINGLPRILKLDTVLGDSVVLNEELVILNEYYQDIFKSGLYDLKLIRKTDYFNLADGKIGECFVRKISQTQTCIDPNLRIELYKTDKANDTPYLDMTKFVYPRLIDNSGNLVDKTSVEGIEEYSFIVKYKDESGIDIYESIEQPIINNFEKDISLNLNLSLNKGQVLFINNSDFLNLENGVNPVCNTVPVINKGISAQIGLNNHYDPTQINNSPNEFTAKVIGLLPFDVQSITVGGAAPLLEELSTSFPGKSEYYFGPTSYNFNYNTSVIITYDEIGDILYNVNLSNQIPYSISYNVPEIDPSSNSWKIENVRLQGCEEGNGTFCQDKLYTYSYVGADGVENSNKLSQVENIVWDYQGAINVSCTVDYYFVPRLSIITFGTITGEVYRNSRRGYLLFDKKVKVSKPAGCNN